MSRVWPGVEVCAYVCVCTKVCFQYLSVCKVAFRQSCIQFCNSFDDFCFQRDLIRCLVNKCARMCVSALMV